jgi:hypothetical protein
MKDVEGDLKQQKVGSELEKRWREKASISMWLVSVI